VYETKYFQRLQKVTQHRGDPIETFTIYLPNQGTVVLIQATAKSLLIKQRRVDIGAQQY